MTRKLKYHEQKLLKKVDFVNWKQDNNHRDHEVSRRYMIQKPEDYHKYNKICGSLRSFAHRLSLRPPDSAHRKFYEDEMLKKLYDMAVLSKMTDPSAVEHLSVSQFARRRLPVVMMRMKYAPTLKAATEMIEGGHVRVGVETITDPAFLVTRNQEEFVTFTHNSKYKRHIMKYKDQLDDFELL